MKLQYLGDARDAFKWDLLHWICTTSSFTNLVFVPLLTEDDPNPTDGQILHHRFECQHFIRPFLNSLKEEPRSLSRIANLGTIHPDKQFSVQTHAPGRVILSGAKRDEYWVDFDPAKFENSVIFYDPDNGYETKTKRGSKWVRHQELRDLFARLPASSMALVYQHKPHRSWIDLFADLAKQLAYVPTAAAVYDSSLAFVATAGNEISGRKIAASLREYSKSHREVKFNSILEG